MADDTRLAEACLLLNYSNQSYRDMMLSSEQLQQQQRCTTTINTGQDSSSRTCNEQTITIKQEPLENPAALPSSLVEEYTGGCREGLASEYLDSEGLTDSYVELPSKEDEKDNPSNDQITNEFCANSYSYIDRDPINNLLAAVNCALPGTKSRPTILQRAGQGSNCNLAISTKSSTYKTASVIPDHNYCLNQYASPATYSNLEHPKASVINQSNLQDLSSSTLDTPDVAPMQSKLVQSKPTRKQKHSKERELEKVQKPLKLVAIHLGAGNSYNETEALQLAKSICEEVMLRDPSTTKLHRRKRKNLNQFNCLDNNVAKGVDCQENSHNFNHEVQMNAETAVVQLIKLMEDNQALNCGYGSNLNIKGQVECDASLMSDKNQVWAGVGAISGCRNPILLAKSLFDHRTIPRPLGLVQPNMLVGSGAKQWMREHCPHLSIVDSKLVSTRAFSTYQKLKSRYDLAIKSFGQSEKTKYSQSGFDGYSSTGLITSTRQDSSAGPSDISPTQDDNYAQSNYSTTNHDHGFYCLKTGQNLQKSISFARVTTHKSQSSDMLHERIKTTTDSTEHYNKDLEGYCLDTVGAIAVDFDNNFASAISSGGLLLKFKGRVGQAAIPGAGCWAEDSVAITTTGVGEYLTQTLFARKFYDKMLMLRLLHDLGHVEKKRDLSDLISCAVEECFEDLMKAPALAHVSPEERLAGMLSISTLNSKDSPNRVDNNDLYLSFGHNCSSMCVAYMTYNDLVGHSLMSRKTDEEKFNVEENDTANSCYNRAVVRTLRFSLDPNESRPTNLETDIQ